MSEIYHWADQIAEEVIERVSKDPQLQKVVEKHGYFVYDEKTPSGHIHIGSGRGWVIHDAIAKALRDRGKKARFVLSSDDMDPLDKPSKELTDEQNERYMGVPFRYIPSPVEGYDSFADYFFKECTELFDEFGIEAELESTGEEYEKGTFNEQIRTALDKAEKIQHIYAKVYGDDVGAANKLPFNPRCPKCGKIATTRTIKWDSKKEEIYFECADDVVDWADGCGHKGWMSPYDGNGKFPWKVEWAAKWPAKGVVVELAGKDHFTKGGSRTVSNRIAVDVFDYPPPYPSKGYYIGKGYEFFTVGGKKMSTSKGRGLGFAESVNIAPPQMLRFLLVRTRPTAVIDFEPYGSNDLILLYERYDRAERAFFGEEDLGEKENKKQARIYELSHVGPIPGRMPPQISLIHASVLVQVYDDLDDIIENLKETGHVYDDVHKQEIEHVKDRLSFARKWVEEFAPDQYRFELQESIPNVKLSEKQKQSLLMLAATLKKGKWTEQTLFDEFYKIIKKLDMNTKDFFKGAYRVLLGMDRGPKLAGFILAAKQQSIQLFEAVKDHEYEEPEEETVDILSALDTKEPAKTSFGIQGTVHKEVRKKMPGTRWAYALVEGVSVKDMDPRLEKIKRKVEASVREQFKGRQVLDDERLLKWRDFQRDIGIDPNSNRLTPEYLLRKVLKGDRMPRINTVVDCANVVSLKNLNPQGAFDLDQIEGNIQIRYAEEGEKYLELFKKKPYTLSSEEIVYADEKKVYSRIHKDSEWTKITKDTSNLLLQYDAIAFQDDDELRERILEFAKLVTAINGGTYEVYVVQ